jgi:hypothetical protein
MAAHRSGAGAATRITARISRLRRHLQRLLYAHSRGDNIAPLRSFAAAVIVAG